jgi:hypothetical protein
MATVPGTPDNVSAIHPSLQPTQADLLQAAAITHQRQQQAMSFEALDPGEAPAYTPEDKTRLQPVWGPRTNIEGYSALSPEDRAKVNAIKQDNAAAMRKRMKQEGE